MTGISMTLAVLVCTSGGPEEAVLLDFTATWCAPCRQVKPLIEKMQEEGYPIRQIDVDRYPDLAKQYGVSSMPSFVMVVDGKEVDRVVGGGDPVVLRPRLERMFQTAMRARDDGQKGPSSSLPDSFALDAPGDAQVRPASFSRVSPEAPLPPTHGSASNSLAPGRREMMPNSCERQCVSASVRLRIEDAQGHSWGTGTIIDARQGKALVLTCGHIFRDSQGQGPIEVHLFGEGSMVKVPGQCLHYDVKTDLGLVIFTPPGEVASIPVAPRGYRAQVGDEVLSVGCDGGATPTMRRHRIQSLDRVHSTEFAYVEVTGAPVQGRSGGGLFSTDGSLLGVCNAADPRDNEGLFAPLVAIHQELDQNQLAFVYESPGGENLQLAEQSRRTDSGSVVPAGVSLSDQATISAIENASMPRSMPTPDAEIDSDIAEAAGLASSGSMTAKEQATLEEIRRRQQDGAEVICIIKSCRDPESPSEIIVLKNASEAFRRALAGGAASPARQSAASRSLSLESRQLPGGARGTRLPAEAASSPSSENPAPFQTSLTVPHARN